MVSQVTVIDRRHGLAGQRLELVSIRSARGAGFVIVRLPDGRRRSIRRSMTDLATAPLQEQGASKPLARIDVRTLLTLMRHLSSTFASRIEEVIRDGHFAEATPRSVPVPHRSPEPGHAAAPETLVRLAGGNAQADRTEFCAVADADATEARADQGGSA